MHTSTPTRTSVVVIGTGFAGLGAGIRLKRAGIQDFVILEGADEVGGTWRDNTYPGAACDIPSHLYSFSFVPKADWTRAYAPQDEIEDYLVACADRYGLRDHIFFRSWVTAAVYDQDATTWTVETDDGRTWVADVVLAGIGPLREPAYPRVPGLDTFRGEVMHTARWDHDVDLRGARVGVVGTGASAIQVVPQVAQVADHVSLFQRTPPWVLPRRDHAYPAWARHLFSRLPGLRAAHRARLYWQKEVRFVAFGPVGAQVMAPVERLAKRHLHHVIDDPELRELLTPDYRMGCKRVLISDDYYASLTQDHVDVLVGGLREVTPNGAIAADGTQVDLDVLVFATGFRVDDLLGPLQVTGRGGRDLNRTWGARPVAYLGATVPGFPNFFIVTGPNTGLGHNSMVFQIESQLNYIMGAVEQLVRGDVAEFDLDEQVLADFEAEMDRRSSRTIWATGCESWYLGDDGVNFTLWPASTVEFRLRTARFDPSKYRVRRRHDVPDPEPVPAAAP